MTPGFVWHAANVHTEKHTHGSAVIACAIIYIFFSFWSSGGWWALIAGGGQGFIPLFWPP